MQCFFADPEGWTRSTPCGVLGFSSCTQRREYACSAIRSSRTIAARKSRTQSKAVLPTPGEPISCQKAHLCHCPLRLGLEYFLHLLGPSSLLPVRRPLQEWQAPCSVESRGLGRNPHPSRIRRSKRCRPGKATEFNVIKQANSTYRDRLHWSHWGKFGGLCLALGFNVVATDPAPNTEASLRQYIDDVRKELTELGLSTGASRDRLEFTLDTCRKAALARS